MAKGRPSLAAGDLFSAVMLTPPTRTLGEHVEAGDVLSLNSICRAGQPFFGVLLAKLFHKRPVVIVTEGLKSQEVFYQDIQTLLGLSAPQKGEDAEPPLRALFYPAWEILPHESKLPHVDVISDRLETLTTLANSARSGDWPLIVTNVLALMQKTFQPGELSKRERNLKRGDVIDPLDLIEWLEDQGYEPEAQVTQKGTLALRGGILDIWPLTSLWPTRLEFFGNELVSLRHFDPQTQISNEEIEGMTISPGGELGILKQELLKSSNFHLSPFLEHLPDNAVFLLCEPELLDEQARRYNEQVPEEDPFHVTWDALRAEISSRGMKMVEACEDNAEESEFENPDQDLRIQSLDAFRPIGERAPEPHIAEAQRKEFFAQLHRWQRQGDSIHVFYSTDGERQRFDEIWKEYGFGGIGEMQLHAGTLARGFLLEQAKTVVVTDAEIFGRYRVQRTRRLKSAHAQVSRSLLNVNFAELEEGDYVVHLQHGIGRYLGLQTPPASQGRKAGTPVHNEPGEECLVIEYAPRETGQPAPKLYVPVSEAHLVGKYVGAGKARPPLNILGGTRWAKAKAQAEVAVRDLAAEMLQIQAVRQSQSGFSMPVDTGWQREFESSFLFEETPDQLKAIEATKKDMELPKPMDRLICGDVGYGKTEVAIRAAFKAAMSGKQVAVLVPTTVLAQQHYNTFCERMGDYPVRIELLSRFRTKRQVAETIRGLAAGSVDIVIGTHRLLQSDIAFKDLGLVVIDEEQRFGVMHKEKLKTLRTLVDVLTLSATPIPRTLYLALAGARDMSTIETPPQDRLPVETIVTQFDERVIRDAIQREINRGGQVFYLHNRVFDIEETASKLRTLLPNVRLAVGHGQMQTDELEKVMSSFVNGEVDVLLSTTIIESGLDIPNANTIIIDRADRFGLSDLYQLRGRVGRYKHQAYAYLLLPRHAGLLTDARKRLSAIKQYSTLGSGFKIAMRDLEIRGAGNLLGAQQSGHITAVGFELYCQLLQQSVSVLKGEKVKRRVDVTTRFDFLAMSPEEVVEVRPTVTPPASNAKSNLPDIVVPREVAAYHTDERTIKVEPAKEQEVRSPAYIPMNYISEARHRIEMYRKLAMVDDLSGLRDLKTEMRDRFGAIPPSVELLFKVGEIKLLAADRMISSIETKEGKLMLTRNNDLVMFSGKFPRLTSKSPSARLNEIKRLLLAL